MSSFLASGATTSGGGGGPLPFSCDPKFFACRLKLLDPNDGQLCGGAVGQQDVKLVKSGLLKGWTADSVRLMLQHPSSNTDVCPQFRWSDDDRRFMHALPDCTSPEDVEASIPAKWLAHDPEAEFDDKLGRVCRMCTALVGKYVAWSSDEVAMQPKTAGQWRERERIGARVKAVVSVLETALGLSIAPESLGDAAFVRRCWAALAEEEQQSVEVVLTSAGDDDHPALQAPRRSSVDETSSTTSRNHATTSGDRGVALFGATATSTGARRPPVGAPYSSRPPPR